MSMGGQMNGWPAKESAKAHNLMLWEAKYTRPTAKRIAKAQYIMPMGGQINKASGQNTHTALLWRPSERLAGQRNLLKSLFI